MSPDATFAGVLVSIPAAILGATTTYFVARRKASGSVNTSEAQQLWQEGQNMRKELRDETVRLRKEVEQWRETSERYRQEAEELHAEVDKLRVEVSRLETALREASRRIDQ